ncbi:trypsin-like peptidase domain-containing protein [Flavobacterium sp. ZT3R18]|uniref:serine protease n=1 Tax=Flavobacterium sp. ZT3R18 TaxID=2594429 RepID=UPI00117A49C6|nr:serine protease [Flavobacterium sp. ZT3R18]TRX37304.1 trypsin-like peptidase domain-containing protein [Flavobacterium sp. ZT3R18]
MQNMDMLSKSIAIVTVFFILSLISERAITWFKLYFFKKGNTLFGYFFNWEKDYSVKTEDPAFEKEREQRILALNISLSIFIAFLIHANLFTILKEDPTTSLGWQKFEWSNIHLELIGCIIGGLLMSLGSKFWHDTLDMLFYAKDLKSKLSDKETYKMNTLKELDEWIAITEADIVKKVFEENKNILKNIQDVISVGIGHNNETKYIEVVTTNNNTHLIPNSFPYYLPNNSVRKIDVKIIVSSPIVTHGNLTFKSDLTNQNKPANYGSYGLAVKFKGTNGSHKMLLTCYHVVIGKRHNYNDFNYIGEENIISPHDSTTVVGSIRNGIRNNSIDVAIIDISDTLSISNKLPNGKNIIKTNPLSGEINNLEARIYGYKTNKTSAVGKVSGKNHDVVINYELPDGTGYEKWNLEDLITISNNNKAISVPGDSGSAVLDNYDNVIGIVVAGNDTHTYAIPIETIFEQLNIELV